MSATTNAILTIISLGLLVLAILTIIGCIIAFIVHRVKCWRAEKYDDELNEYALDNFAVCAKKPVERLSVSEVRAYYQGYWALTDEQQTALWKAIPNMQG